MLKRRIRSGSGSGWECKKMFASLAIVLKKLNKIGGKRLHDDVCKYVFLFAQVLIHFLNRIQSTWTLNSNNWLVKRCYLFFDSPHTCLISQVENTILSCNSSSESSRVLCLMPCHIIENEHSRKKDKWLILLLKFANIHSFRNFSAFDVSIY